MITIFQGKFKNETHHVTMNNNFQIKNVYGYKCQVLLSHLLTHCATHAAAAPCVNKGQQTVD